MQYQSPMEEKQRGSKVLHVLEASSDGLEFLNVSIESFSSSVVSSQCHCIDHSVYVSIEHISDFGNLRNASLHRLIAPHDEQGGSCRPAVGCMHDIPEILLDAPCSGHLIVGILDCVEPDSLAVCKVGRILQEQELRPSEFRSPTYFPLSHIVHCIVKIGDKMEHVMADMCLGKVFLCSQHISLPHIHAYSLYPLLLQWSQRLVYQLIHILLLAAADHVKDDSRIIVRQDAYIVMPLMKGLLINAQMPIDLCTAPKAQSEGNGTLHDMTDLIHAQPEDPGRARLTLGLEQISIVFFRADLSAVPLNRPREQERLPRVHPNGTAVCVL